MATNCQWKVFFSAKNSLQKGKGSDLRAGPPRINFLVLPRGVLPQF